MFFARLNKIFLGIFVGVLALYWMLYGISYYLFSQVETQKKGLILTKITSDSINVIRDDFGVPNIYAKNDYDAFFAQGFVTAQDRLWQLEIYRLAVNGELSTVFDKETEKADIFLKTIGFKKLGTELEKNVSDSTKTIIKAYTDGINAFIDFQKGSSGNDFLFPIEFTLVDFQPKKWEISDVLGLVRMLGWELSIATQKEIIYGELFKKFGKKAAELYPKKIEIADEELPRPKNSLLGSDFWQGKENLEKFLSLNSFGSNAWAVSGKKTKTGKPMLANDPHLKNEVPSKWYEIGIFAPNFRVKGFSIPGVPCVLIGHNDVFGWGITNLKTDDADFTILEMQNKKTYFFGSQTCELETEFSQVNFKTTKEPKLFEIHKSKFGTVVTDVLGKDKNEVLALQWIGFDTKTDEISGFYKICKANNLNEFREGLQKISVPSLNFTFADTSGNIGLQSAGKIPVRNYKVLPFPVVSKDTTRIWTNFIPFEDLPFELNPETNFIANSNNPVFAKNGFFITDFWEPTSRFERVSEFLSSKNLLTNFDFEVLQNDFYSKQAEKTIKFLFNGEVVSLENDYKKSVSFLTNWDFYEAPESIEASLYNAFWFKLVENLYKDEFFSGAKTKQDTMLWKEFGKFGSLVTLVTNRVLEEQNSVWIDDVNTQETETLRKIVSKSLKESVDYLKQRFGEPLESWEWGKIHTVTQEHLLGKINFLETTYNIGPFEAGGSTCTVNLHEYYFDKPFETVVAPSLRQILDFSDFNKTKTILPSGQSSQRFSTEAGFSNSDYANQNEFFRGKLYKPSLWDSTEIFDTFSDKLILKKDEN
ncbi:penicillin acylase family protein [bacterium]|nr:penicillin acylase family protein [bacterium]